jgi:hypothetical protein
MGFTHIAGADGDRAYAAAVSNCPWLEATTTTGYFPPAAAWCVHKLATVHKLRR